MNVNKIAAVLGFALWAARHYSVKFDDELQVHESVMRSRTVVQNAKCGNLLLMGSTIQKNFPGCAKIICKIYFSDHTAYNMF